MRSAASSRAPAGASSGGTRPEASSCAATSPGPAPRARAGALAPFRKACEEVAIGTEFRNEVNRAFSRIERLHAREERR